MNDHLAQRESSMLSFDLKVEIERLYRENTEPSGRKSKTLVKHSDLRIVLIVMKANAKLAQHKSIGRISVQVLRGHIQSVVDGALVDLSDGNLLALDRDVLHDVKALEESAFLLTIAHPNEDEKS